MNGMAQNPMVFFPLAFYILSMASLVLLSTGPVQAALALVLSMSGLALLFMAMGAYFIGGVQLVVYAGAVMVLFLMVIMLFDLKKREDESFLEGPVLGKFLTVGTIGVFLGVVLGSLSLKTYRANNEATLSITDSIKSLSHTLFTDYVLLFEAVGVLLLVIAVAVVSVSRVGGDADDGN